MSINRGIRVSGGVDGEEVDLAVRAHCCGGGCAGEVAADDLPCGPAGRWECPMGELAEFVDGEDVDDAIGA